MILEMIERERNETDHRTPDIFQRIVKKMSICRFINWLKLAFISDNLR